MRIKANSNVVHGAYNLTRGHELDIPDASAEDLINAGLAVAVEEKQAPVPENKMAQAPANKAKAK